MTFKLEFVSNILSIIVGASLHVLLTIEKGIRGEISHTIYWYAGGYNKYIKDYDTNKKNAISFILLCKQVV